MKSLAFQEIPLGLPPIQMLHDTRSPGDKTPGCSKPSQRFNSFKLEFWNFLGVGVKLKGVVLTIGNKRQLFPHHYRNCLLTGFLPCTLGPHPWSVPLTAATNSHLGNLNLILSGEDLICWKHFSNFPYFRIRMKSLMWPEGVTVYSVTQTKTVLGGKGDPIPNFLQKQKQTRTVPSKLRCMVTIHTGPACSGPNLSPVQPELPSCFALHSSQAGLLSLPGNPRALSYHRTFACAEPSTWNPFGHPL